MAYDSIAQQQGRNRTHRMTRSRKIWIGIGVATLTQATVEITPAVPAVAVGETAASRSLLQKIGTEHQPGQPGSTGGENYLRDGGPSDTRTRFSRDMILLRGHALIADELVASGDWSGALAHLTTSTDELRTYLETYMRGQGVAPFTAPVAKLTAAIAQRNLKSYMSAREAYNAHADLASKAVRKFQVPYHRFAIRAAVEALKASSSAYAASVSDGSITDAAEYQDSRGFGLAAVATIELIEADLSKIDADRVRQLQALIVALLAAWPATAPPLTITLSAEDVATLVSKIEDLAVIFR